MDSVLNHIAEQNNIQIQTAEPLYGGDINKAYLLRSDTMDYVVKVNSASLYPNMFETEAKGLFLLRSSNSFRIPEVIAVGELNDQSYIMMEFIESGSASRTFWGEFAIYLASLHKNSQKSFGLDHSNYIGRLPQYNSEESTASDFYIHQRLEPQFRMAYDEGYEFKNLGRFYSIISEEIPNEASSLIHGDLWNGNYLISDRGVPSLIDPAVAYAPREMDLAMMKLFGGFPSEVYTLYHEEFPLKDRWEERIKLWQLYYLLVHLNLFGSGYFNQVHSIVKQYS
jgi:fructosamine-3-kinase